MKHSLPSPIAGALDSGAFDAPGAAPRIMPFWFWNSEMSEELVRRQVHQMADAGVGGFFIHPRQGLKLPYLSAKWFARVQLAVEVAQERGLQAWLYDEFPYPSGMAGGFLTANRPDFRARSLERFVIDIGPATPAQAPQRREFPMGRIVSALACPLRDGRVVWEQARDVREQFGVVLTREMFWQFPIVSIPYNEKRFMADEGRLILDWEAPAEAEAEGEEWRVFVGIEREPHHFKFYFYYFDSLCPGAAQEFLRLTHEGYARSVGQQFGHTIPGIFSDETEPPTWSPHIEAELRTKWDLDLSLLLPALHHDHPRAAEVRLRFRDCALRLFQERWERPITDWCAAHDLLWCAERPTRRPAQFLGVTQPATDAGHRRVGVTPNPLSEHLRDNNRAAISAAEQSGTEQVRCECFHSLGWGVTLQDQKWQIDWLTVQGANRFTPHAFYASSSGLNKHDAAPSFFAENPYWPHFHWLADYTARLSLAMSSGRERARIAVLHPTESLWIGTELSRHTRQDYNWLMNELVAQHQMFHLVDALALRGARAVAGALEVGRVRYETLLIPPLCVLDDDTRSAVRAALDAGMTVLMAPPFGSIAPPLSGADELLQWPGITLVPTRDAWIEHLEARRPLSVADQNGAQLRTVWTLWREAFGDENREAGAQQWLFVANTDGSAVTAHLEIEADVAGWENWSLESGEKSALAARIESGRSHLSLHLPPFGSALLVSAPRNATKAAALPLNVPADAAAPTDATVLATEGSWELSLDRPNALRLNRWRVVCDGGDWADAGRDDSGIAEVEAVPLKFRINEQITCDWTAPSRASMPEVPGLADRLAREWVELCSRRGESPVWYRRHVACEFVPGDLEVLIEQGAIVGRWTLFINGQEVPRGDFAPAAYHGDDKTSARVSRFFRVGDNLLALRVEDAPELGGLRTPLHLTGSFGLGGQDQRVVQAMPRHAPFNDLVVAGLPHFAGAATYRREIARRDLGDVVTLPRGFEEIAELRIDGQPLGVRPWSPYEWTVPTQCPEWVPLEITVTNTLLGFVEGQVWDSPTQTLRSV